MAHRPWLQTAIPAEATRHEGCIMPNCDLIYKYVRMRGKTICIAFVYFDHTIGLVGRNLEKLNKLTELRDSGRVGIIAAGDYNMKAEDWNSDILSKLDFTIIQPKTDMTCRTTAENGGSVIDYILASTSIVPLIKNVGTVGGSDERRGLHMSALSLKCMRRRRRFGRRSR